MIIFWEYYLKKLFWFTKNHCEFFFADFWSKWWSGFYSKFIIFNFFPIKIKNYLLTMFFIVIIDSGTYNFSNFNRKRYSLYACYNKIIQKYVWNLVFETRMKFYLILIVFGNAIWFSFYLKKKIDFVFSIK